MISKKVFFQTEPKDAYLIVVILGLKTDNSVSDYYQPIEELVTKCIPPSSIFGSAKRKSKFPHRSKMDLICFLIKKNSDFRFKKRLTRN